MGRCGSCRCNPCRSIAGRLWRESVVAGIGISTSRLCKARPIMEIELSSWRAFARSTSLTREERSVPPSGRGGERGGGWLYSAEVEGMLVSACGDS